ncbi:MAG: c-type cytochrome [Shewanella sp.]
MNINKLIIGLTLCSVYASAAVVAADAPTMAVIPPAAQLCVSCHGIGGEGIEPLGPPISRITERISLDTIAAFPSGR